MNLVEFTEKISPLPLSEWQKQFLSAYEQVKKKNKRLVFVPTRINGRRMLIQIIQAFEEQEHGL